MFSQIELYTVCQNYDNVFNCFDVIRFCKNQSILFAVEIVMSKKVNWKLKHQLGPVKGSRITSNNFK